MTFGNVWPLRREELNIRNQHQGSSHSRQALHT